MALPYWRAEFWDEGLWGFGMLRCGGQDGSAISRVSRATCRPGAKLIPPASSDGSIFCSFEDANPRASTFSRRLRTYYAEMILMEIFEAIAMTQGVGRPKRSPARPGASKPSIFTDQTRRQSSHGILYPRLQPKMLQAATACKNCPCFPTATARNPQLLLQKV